MFHRLNRTEYQNAVNQLLGTSLSLRDQLPADPVLFGFDNNSDAPVSAPLVRRYFNLAQAAVGAALADAGVRERLVPCPLESDGGCARRAVENFLSRAFRRPADAQEVDEHLALVGVCGDDAVGGLGCAFEAALVSPSFLFRSELVPHQAGTCSESAPLTGNPDGTLGGFALASRLAFFLWSGPPDRELYDLAAAGRLHEPDVLEAQVHRMLAPEMQGRFLGPFVEAFPTRWLDLEGVASAAPSSAIYPAFDEALRESMVNESRLFFSEILRGNASVLDLVQAPFTFVDQRLARHYGLADLAGTDGVEMRKVSTVGTARGGVPTQASLLTITSSSENTSIVARGRWVLSNLLCTSLDDPPPGALEMVPSPDPSLGLTRRQSLERRTAIPPCNACHDILNPIGFGLERFDGIGAERTTENGRPLDTSGALPSGQRFADTAQMLTLLRQDPRFPRCLTRKLLTYALGRGLSGPCDDSTVEDLSMQLEADGFRFKNHLVRIVQSSLFRSTRRVTEPASP